MALNHTNSQLGYVRLFEVGGGDGGDVKLFFFFVFAMQTEGRQI